MNDIPCFEVIYEVALPSGKKLLLRAVNGSALYQCHLFDCPMSWAEMAQEVWNRERAQLVLNGFWYKGYPIQVGDQRYDRLLKRIESSQKALVEALQPQIEEKQVIVTVPVTDWRNTLRWVVAVGFVMYVLSFAQYVGIAMQYGGG